MKILLVEDDKGIGRFVEKGLVENGYIVDVTFDGETGLRSALQQHYDLIVLDIMLPKMDGREVLNRIRAREIQTPVIFLTAKDSESDIVQGLHLGADDYLTKPFSFSARSWKIGAKFYRRTDIKMTLWYILTFLVSALMICTFLYLGLRYRLLKEIDQFLLDETKEMERVLSQEQKETYFLMGFEDEVMTRKYYPFFFQILNKKEY